MTEERFWDIIAASRRGIAGDAEGFMDAQAESLSTLLGSLAPKDVRSFDQHFSKKMQDAYTWDLWGAAHVIASGCSDDGFSDFRAWLISMGRAAYYDALKDPESLVGPAGGSTVEDVFFEEFQNVASAVYEELTGNEMPDPPEEMPSSPVGQRWSSDAELRARFPRLVAAFAA